MSAKELLYVLKRKYKPYYPEAIEIALWVIFGTTFAFATFLVGTAAVVFFVKYWLPFILEL